MDDFDKDFPDLLQKITHSGDKELDGIKIKKIDQLVSSSSKNCKSSYQQIMRHLEKKHAEVRFSTLLICDYLVKNNKMFRKLLIGEDMTKFMELTLGTNKSNPLPPPKTAAKELNSKALSVIFNWHSDFGKTFMELANAYFFLKDCMKVDFASLERQRSAARVKAEMEEKRAIAKREEQLNKALKEFKDFSEEAQSLCTELESCISLLLPPPEDFFLPLESETTAGSSSDPSLRVHGIVSAGTSIPIHLTNSVPKIVITEDNQPIVESARDLHSQLTKNHLKRVESWVDIFSNQPDHMVKFQTCKALLGQYKKILAQYSELGLKPKRRLMSDSSDDDFEEVDTKEGYEEKVKDELLASIIASKAEKAKQVEEKKRNKLLGKTDTKEKSKTIVKQSTPKEKLPTSIEEWEKRTVCLPPVIVSNRPDNSQVWIGPSVADSEEIKVPEIESCPVDFTSTFEPVKWACRAPLQNGSLCPRKDRVKCPFHGKVVPRDETGKCVREEDAKAEQLRKERHMAENPDWQDPKLLAEIKKATGLDLEMPKKGKRKKRAPEFPGLTDIKLKKDSPRKRLARKILTKSELRQIKSKLEIEPEDATEKEFYLSDDSDS